MPGLRLLIWKHIFVEGGFVSFLLSALARLCEARRDFFPEEKSAFGLSKKFASRPLL